jgi:hypothetical protein
MATANLYVAWIAILAGLLAGATIGMCFHVEGWLGGYPSWRRRMLRLTHISLVGTGLLKLAFVLSVEYLNMGQAPRVASVLFIVGAVTMPAVCLLSAWRVAMRHFFFIPVVSLIAATVDFIYRGLTP